MASIQRRGENSFRLIVELGYDTKGKRIRRTKTIKVNDPALLKRKKGLKEFLNKELMKFQIEVESGEYISPEKMMFSDFVKEWKRKYGKKHLSGNTLDTYEYLLNGKIIETFGDMRLDDIKTLHLVNYLDDLEKANLSSATIMYHYRILNDIFKRSVEWKLLKENPMDGVARPKVVNKNGDVYNEEEINKLFDLLKDEPIHWRLAVKLAIIAGLRRGELLGLQWEDVDFSSNTISVNHSLARSKEYGFVLKDPKTKYSRRTVSIPGSIMDELKKYQAIKYKEKEKLNDFWEGGEFDFVFSKLNGEPYTPKAITRWWKRFIERTKFRFVRFHDLRHTSATVLINRGVHAKIISSRLGHADIRTTMNIYGHAMKVADEGAAEKFDDILNNHG
ncbi:tyrosine-type recombinase/integrase [Heyndrickxia ginsengihumi]|uniref:tyrosine-type recombinase/integrase n=1 Tax=Heyndrickxia ginsengihumi TaxID=363870 RepID=UPI003D1E8A9B